MGKASAGKKSQDLLDIVVVREGDSAWDLACSRSTDLPTLERLNPNVDLNDLYPGQVSLIY